MEGQTLTEALDDKNDQSGAVEQEDRPEQDDSPPEKEQQIEDQPKQTVPVGTLIEERRARQAAERQLQELTDRQKLVDERLAEINARLNPDPDPEDDPFGHIEHELKATRNDVQGIKDDLKKTSSENQAQLVLDRVARMEETFAQNTPDYYEAMTFLQTALMEQAQDFGLSEGEAQSRYIKDVQEATVAALKSGKNPSEIAYKWAQRMGYRKPQSKENGVSKAKTSLDAVAEGLKNQGLSGTGGGAPKGEITAEDLASMKPEKFNEFLDKAEKAGKSARDIFKEMMP